MLLKELIRFSTQNRTLYCYMLMSLWIFLLIAGMYKYIGQNNNSLSSIFTLTTDEPYSVLDVVEDVESFSKYKQRCMALHEVGRGEDGGILDGWKLQGLLMVIRHGDRGPMSHVRAVDTINCGIAADSLVNRYRSFLYNSTSSSGANHMYWNKVGPFHGFALLPPTDRACLLGQLTYKGIAQLLHVGEILHQIYAHPLGLLNKSMAYSKPIVTSTPHSLLNSDEVVLYTTRYRRTFQSALALLYSFLPADKWLAMNVRESHSMAFCFNDCACAQSELLRKRLKAMNEQHLEAAADIRQVMQHVGGTLLQHTPNGINDINEVVDATLTVLCHEAPLPCRHLMSNGSVGGYAAAAATTATLSQAAEMSDVINIDQDDGGATGNGNEYSVAHGNAAPANMPQDAMKAATDIATDCISADQMEALLAFAHKQSTAEARHVYYKRIGLLRAYGMIRHIVSCMLKMISGDRTKFVLYSGHDWTLQYLTAALGIETQNTYIPYATRLAIEVYKSEAHTDYYFRVVYNGRDVTRQIDFCEGGKSLRITRDSRGNKADLCPIENIIRFLHEDYFAPLNATNFKDACAVAAKANEV